MSYLQFRTMQLPPLLKVSSEQTGESCCNRENDPALSIPAMNIPVVGPEAKAGIGYTTSLVTGQVR